MTGKNQCMTWNLFPYMLYVLVSHECLPYFTIDHANLLLLLLCTWLSMYMLHYCITWAEHVPAYFICCLNPLSFLNYDGQLCLLDPTRSWWNMLWAIPPLFIHDCSWTCFCARPFYDVPLCMSPILVFSDILHWLVI